jgi:hypothetical protein
MKPYAVPQHAVDTPDSLHVVFLNHVGRHGSRFPASANNTVALRNALLSADSLGSITPTGRRLLQLTDYVSTRARNYWGALDSLGMAEQRGLASRMFVSYPELFTGGTVRAISSYSPRCVMSMYEFTHQLDRLNNKVEIFTSAGRSNSPLMRPFDVDNDFLQYVNSKVWETPYNDYAATQISTAPLKRILGASYPLNRSDADRLAMAEYQFVAGLAAMEIDVDMSQFFSRDEINALWSCLNLRQYLLRTANTLSSEPADVASKLLVDLITTTDAAVEGKADATVMLRFGHAETLMPLLSLMRLRGCYYLTNYFDTVAQHFRDFDVVPMSANLQMILMRSDRGRYYVRFDLNEVPIALMPNDNRIYLPWTEARDYLSRCLPLIDRP